MNNLSNLISNNENWLLEQLLNYAREHNYTDYSSTLKEAWRKSIAGTSNALLKALELYDSPLEIEPQEDYSQDPATFFAVQQAVNHRNRGIQLTMFLGILKYYRKSYIDLLKHSGFSGNYYEYCRSFIDSFFDRIEIAICSEWNEISQNSVFQQLQDNNRNMINEKNKYLTVFESIPNPVFLLDQNYQIENMNKAAAELLEDAYVSGAYYYNKGSRVMQWLDEELENFPGSSAKQLTFEKEISTGNYKYVFEVRLEKMLDVSEKFRGTVVIFNDITERKHFERALSREKEWLSVLLSSIGDAVIAVDNDEKIILVNPTAENLTGWNSDEAMGKPLDEVFFIVNEYTREKTKNPVQKVLSQGNIVGLANHTALISRYGSEYSIADSAAPIKDAHGNISGVIMVFRDVTGKRKQEQELIDSESRFRLLAENARDIIYRIQVSPEQKFEYVSPAATSITGYTPRECYDDPSLRYRIVHPEDRGILAEMSSHGGQGTFTLRWIRKDGGIIWIEQQNTPIYNNRGRLVAIEGIARDITKRKQAEDKLRETKKQLTEIIEFLPDPTFVIDTEGKVISWNRAMEELTGICKENMLGQGNYIYSLPFHGKAIPALIDYINSNVQDIPLINYYYIKKENQLLYAEGFVPSVFFGKGAFLWLKAAPLFDSDGNIMGAVESIRDITERKEIQNKLEYLSLHDPLTELYNRNYFEQEMSRLEAERSAPLGLIVCDVDGLKLVNDTLGHHKGDYLLIEAAKIIKKAFRKEGIVARVGGDEFAVLLPGNDEYELEKASRRLKDNIYRYNESNPEIPINISAGYAVRNDSTVYIKDLFREADNNMYREKLHHSTSSRSTIVKTLTKALEARDFITEGHADRLQYKIVLIAEALEMPEHKISDLRLLAQFHDIGKVGIPDRILFKPGPLTAEEVEEMKRHCEIGYRIAQSSAELVPVADYILKHHEWWDGSGYPLGLKGEEIPLECRILSIIDAYDAMTSNRPYRTGIPHENALAEIKKCSGTQFDPHVVEVFLKLMNQ